MKLNAGDKLFALWDKISRLQAACAATPLTAVQRRVLDVVILATTLQDRHWAAISGQDFANVTGIDVREVRRALAALVEMGILKKHAGPVNSWMVEGDPRSWLVLPQRTPVRLEFVFDEGEPDSLEVQPAPVVGSLPGLVSRLVPSV